MAQLDTVERAIAVTALRAWRKELRDRTRTATTFDALWVAACEAVDGLEVEHTFPSWAAQSFHRAAAVVQSQAAA